MLKQTVTSSTAAAVSSSVVGKRRSINKRHIHQQQHQSQQPQYHQESESSGGHHHPWLNSSMSEALIASESKAHMAVDCCPTVLEMIQPEGGKNPDGMYVVLYKEGSIRQRFFEQSCREDVRDKPCRFMEKRFHNRSKCVQKYSYSYAIVQDPSPAVLHYRGGGRGPSGASAWFQLAQNGSWYLDYIQIRSGCNCEIYPKKKTRNKSTADKKLNNNSDSNR